MKEDRFGEIVAKYKLQLGEIVAKYKLQQQQAREQARAALIRRLASGNERLQGLLSALYEMRNDTSVWVSSLCCRFIDTVFNNIVDLEKRIATLISQLYFYYFSRLLNRRFRNGRRSRRALLHHAYLTCSSSLETFLMKFSLANGMSTRG